LPASVALAIVTLAVIAFALACGGGNASVTAASICAATPEPAGMVSSGDLIEASGIASSRIKDNILWAHNDSGDSARVFALGRETDNEGRQHARQHATYTLPGAEAIDWEDMAIGPGPDGDTSYLYLADIGDNAAQRPEVIVYRVREPEVVEQPDTPSAGEFTDVEKLTLRYPDNPHDAETLLVDPVTGDLIIVTKELAGGPSFVFRAPASLDASTTTTLEQVAEIDFNVLLRAIQVPADAPPLVRGLPHLPTGGDVSPDGRLVAIRTYLSVLIWDRDEEQPLWTAFADLPCLAPSAIEPQGEAIAFDADGRGYTTVSEGTNPPLHHFSAK
jgi:hypothetical protein